MLEHSVLQTGVADCFVWQPFALLYEFCVLENVLLFIYIYIYIYIVADHF